MKERLMKIFDKRIRRKIVAILLGCICTVSVIMSIWYVWRSMSMVTSSMVGATAVLQGDEAQGIENDNVLDEENNRLNDDVLDEEKNRLDDNILDEENSRLNDDVLGEENNRLNEAGESSGLEDANLVNQPDPSSILESETAESEIMGLEHAGIEDTYAENADEQYPVEELYGDLIITNYIEAQGEEVLDPDKAFHFTIKVGEEVYEHALKAGESYRIKNIPVGTAYEIEAANYLSEYYVNESRHLSGSIVMGENPQAFSSILTPASEVERMIDLGIIVVDEENELDITDVPETTEAQIEPEVPQEPEVINTAVTADEQEASHYIGEISIPEEARPMAIISWLIILMVSIVALKVIIVTPWLKESF